MASLNCDQPLMVFQAHQHIFVNLSKIKQVLNRNNNPNMIVDDKKHSLLQMAIAQGCCKSIVKYLAKEKIANINYQNSADETCLHIAVKHKRYSIIKQLLSLGINFDIKDIKGYNAFHLACDLGDLEAVNLLIDKVSWLHSTDEELNTPLHKVCTVNNQNVMKIVKLIHTNMNRADFENVISHKNTFGESVLHSICKFQNNTEVLKYMLKMTECDIDACDDKGQTPLHHCVMNPYSASVTMMVLLTRKGADIDIQDCSGYTALCVLVMQNSLKLATFLSEAYNSIYSPYNTYTYRPYISKTRKGPEMYIKSLFDTLDDEDVHLCLNKADKYGDTLLHHLYKFSGNFKHWMFDQIALDVNVQNSDGETPLHVAATNNDCTLVSLCLNSKSTNMSLRSKSNKTAFEMAFLPGHDEVTNQFLLKMNKDIFEENPDMKRLISVSNVNGNSLLHFTIVNPKLASCIIKNTQCVNVQNQNKDTPLHKACDGSCKRTYLKSGQTMNSTPEFFQLSNSIKDFLQAGADLTVKNSDTFTPLYLAFRTLNYVAFQTILSRLIPTDDMDSIFGKIGNIEYKNGMGDTLFLAANKCKAPEYVINYLLVTYSNCFKASNNGLRAIHIATKMGNKNLLEQLLQNGEDINITSPIGTPLYIALDCGKIGIIEMVLKKNASLKVSDRYSCLEIASRKNMKYTPLLLKHGANIHEKVDRSTVLDTLLKRIHIARINAYSTTSNWLKPLFATPSFIKQAIKIMISAGSAGANAFHKGQRSGFKGRFTAQYLFESILLEKVDVELLYYFMLTGFHFMNSSIGQRSKVYDEFISNPLKLKDICSHNIRTKLRPNAWVAVSSLPLPDTLQKYITFDHESYFHDYINQGYKFMKEDISIS